MICPVVLLALAAVTTEQIFISASQSLQAGRLAEAEQGFLEVLKREPSNIGALGNLGVIYSRGEQPTKAIGVYQRALKLAPGEPGLLLNLGLAYLKIDDFANAKPLFAQLAPRPGSRQVQARELLAITQLQTGEIAPALTTLAELAAAPSPSTGVLHFLALGHLKQGDKQKAAAVLDRLFASLPPARGHYLQGRVWYDAAVFDNALASFTKAAAIDPTLPGLALETGKTQLSLRNAAAAEQSLRAAHAANPNDAETTYFLGALLVQNGKPAEGAPLLAKVRAQRPDLWGTAYYLGKASLALGRAAAAIPMLQEALRHSPRESAVHYQLARAFQAAGRTAEAKQTFAALRKLQSGAETAPPEPSILR